MSKSDAPSDDEMQSVVAPRPRAKGELVLAWKQV